jgi:hypothetical protein
MSSSKKDPEMSAFEAIHSALKPLDPSARRRVLGSIFSLLEIPSLSPQPQQMLQPSQSASVKTIEPSARNLSNRPISLIELMQDKKPVTNAQRIALFAYYREMHEGLPRFARDDLLPYFGRAREKPPANYARDFSEAVKNGWVHEDGTDSYITSKGIESVEGGFLGESAKSGSPKTISKRIIAKSKHQKRK